MTQYIQKPGGGKVTLESQGFPNLQDAANQGYSIVASPLSTSARGEVENAFFKKGTERKIENLPYDMSPLEKIDLNNDVLNSVNLGNTPNTDFETDLGTFPADIGSLNANVSESGQITPTSGEQEAQGFVDQIKGLYGGLEGESAYRTQQEEEQGLPGLTSTQQELTNQLNSLQKEYASIQPRLQNWSEGRGITTSAFNTMKDTELNKNAIQALGVSALLEASQGNLSTAQNLVDRRVAAKYDPIREKINTVTNNLNLIIKSPEYSLEQQNRASAQLEIQNQRKADIAKAEQTETNVQNIAIEAAQLVDDTSALQAIQNAPDEITAYNIAGRLMEGGWEYVNTPLKRDQLASQGYEIYVNEALGRTYVKKPGAIERDTQIVTAGGRSILVDKQTGETIQDLGSAYKDGGGSSSATIFKFSSDDKGRLLAVNFTTAEVADIQSDINEFGIEQTVAGMTPEQAKAVRNIASGVTPTQEQAQGEPNTISEGKRKVIGGVNALISDNASNAEIEEYISLKGYTKENFADVLSTYTPETKPSNWEKIKSFFGY